MMQWMSTEKISKADKECEKEITMDWLYSTIAGYKHYFEIFYGKRNEIQT